MSNIHTLKEHSVKYSASWDGYDYDFEIDDRYLTKKWRSKESTGSKSYLLHDLSPKLSFIRCRDSESMKVIRNCLIMIIASIIIFFSDYNKTIPLLAPVLFLLAIAPITNHLNKAFPRDWIYIYDNSGNYEASILVPEDESETAKEERIKFQDSLTKSIETATAKEYQG